MPRDVAVVVGAEQVDHAVVAALELVLVVGDVVGEVGRLAAGADQHAVLVVAELLRPQPQRPLGAIGVAALLEQRDRALHGAGRAVVEGALEEPGVEVDPVGLERGPDAGHDRLDALGGQDSDVLVGRAGDLPRQLGHVVALVAVLGQRLATGAGADRLAEAVDLGAGVVEVVLARNRVAGLLEDPRQRIAERGVAAGRGGQRAGRVGGDELEDHLLGLLRRPGAERVAGLQQGLQRADEPVLGQEDVEEARPGHLDALDPLAQPPGQLAGQPLGDLARRRAERGRQQHRGVGRVVAEALLLRALERRPAPRWTACRCATRRRRPRRRCGALRADPWDQ